MKRTRESDGDSSDSSITSDRQAGRPFSAGALKALGIKADHGNNGLINRSSGALIISKENIKKPEQSIIKPYSNPIGKIVMVDTKHGASIEKKVDKLLCLYDEQIKLTRELCSKLDQNTAKIDDLHTKTDLNTCKLETLERNRGLTNDMSYEKPDFIPFRSMEAVLSYEEYDHAKRCALKNYLHHFRLSSTAYDMLKNILKNDHLMPDDILIQFNYLKVNKVKTNTSQGTQLDLDIYAVVLKTYPDYCLATHLTNFRKALVAACARVNKSDNISDDETTDVEKENSNQDEKKKSKSQKKKGKGKKIPLKNTDLYAKSTDPPDTAC